MRLLIAGSGSSGNTYILDSGDEYLILDAGISLKQTKTMINFEVSKISGVLVSHAHKDHDLHSHEYEKMGLPVIRPFDDNHKSAKLRKCSCFTITPFPLQDREGNWVHLNSDNTPCPIYGFYITHKNTGHKLVYATDCEVIKWKFPDVNTYLIEANYDVTTLDDADLKSRRVFGSHQSIQAACKFIAVNHSDALKNVILCHLSATNGSPAHFKEYMQNVVGNNVSVYVAKGGLVIDLG